MMVLYDLSDRVISVLPRNRNHSKVLNLNILNRKVLTNLRIFEIIISEQIKSPTGIALFIIFAATSILGQIYLLRKIKKELREESLGQSSLMKVVMTIQFVLIAIIISVVILDIA
jgi:hypothetical protein